MSRFARSCTTAEEACFTLHIEHFSKLACKGFYTSPSFESKPSGTKWSLIVYADDVADYENFIHVRLKRDEYEVDRQTVEAKTSVIDCFGWSVLNKTKEITFTGFEEARILSVTKERVAGNFGLNRFWLLPNDTLTLQCEFVIHECTVLDFDTKEDFEDSLKESSPGMLVEYFVHSDLTTEAFDFFRRIDNFSVHTCSGRYACTPYQRHPSDSKWTLIVYVDDNNYGGDFLDIRLKSDEIKEPQLVKVKLSIVARSDGSEKVLLSSEKDVYFPDALKEARILTVSQKSMSSWLGWSKRRLIPDDCLDLHCEIVTFKDISDVFDDKGDFDYSLKTHDGYRWKQIIPFLLTVYISLLVLILVVIAAYCVVMHIIVPFITSTIEYVAHTVISVLVVVVIALYAFFRIRKDGERGMKKAKYKNKKEGKRENFKHKRKSHFYRKNEKFYYVQPSYGKQYY